MGQLRGDGHDIIELTGDTSADSTHKLRTAISSGDVERLLVAGGDGLVHLAIQELAETGIPLLISPTGSGNDFATALGIDSKSVRALLSDAPCRVDLLRISTGSMTRWVASIVIAGFPATINERANSMALPIGRHVYTVAAALELPTYRRTHLELRVDDETLSLDSGMLAIGNTSLFGGGMLACPSADPTDGLAEVTSIEGVGRVAILGHLQKRAGGSADRPEVLRTTGKHITLETSGVSLWGDGEKVAISPAVIETVPGALAVHCLICE